MNLQGRVRLAGQGVFQLDGYRFFPGFDNHTGKFLPAAIKQLQRITGLHAQHPADVMGAGFRQLNTATGKRLVDVKTGQTHGYLPAKRGGKTAALSVGWTGNSTVDWLVVFYTVGADPCQCWPVGGCPKVIHNLLQIKGGYPQPVKATCHTRKYSMTSSNQHWIDRKSTRLNSSHVRISYAVFCLKKKKKTRNNKQRKKKKYQRTTTTSKALSTECS